MLSHPHPHIHLHTLTPSPSHTYIHTRSHPQPPNDVMRLPTEGSALRAYRMAQRDEYPLPADHTLLTTLPGWSPTTAPSPSPSSSSSSSSSRNYNDYSNNRSHNHSHSHSLDPSYSEIDGNLQAHNGSTSTSNSYLNSSSIGASDARASSTASLLERQEYLDRMKKLRATVLTA